MSLKASNWTTVAAAIWWWWWRWWVWGLKFIFIDIIIIIKYLIRQNLVTNLCAKMLRIVRKLNYQQSLPQISFAWGIIHGEWWTLSRNISRSAVQHVGSGSQEGSWEQLDEFSTLHRSCNSSIWMLFCNLLPYAQEGFAIFLCIWIACNLVANFYQLLVRSLCIWMLVAINRVCNFFPYQLQGNPRQSLNNLCIWFWKLSESKCVNWVWYWACSRI